MTVLNAKPAIRGNTLLFERKFVPLQQDVSSNNVNILNDGKILLLVDDDENSTTTINYLHGFLGNFSGLDIEKPTSNDDGKNNSLSQFYQRKQFSLGTDERDELGLNKFLKKSDQLNDYQFLINSQYETSVRKVIKNSKYPIFLVFTNNFNVLSFDYKNDNSIDQTNHQHFKFLQNVDHSFEESGNPDLRYNIYYDAVFDSTGDYLFISNRKGDVLLFKYHQQSRQFKFVSSNSVIDSDNSKDEYLISLRNLSLEKEGTTFGVLGKSSKNNFYKIFFDINKEASENSALSITNKSFMISDFVNVSNRVFYISANKLYDVNNEELAIFSNYDLKQIIYIKSLEQLIIYSNNELYIFDLKTMQLVETPVLNFLMRKHNVSKLDNSHLSLNIHGIDVSNNESILTVLYSYTTNGGVRYVTSIDRELSLSILRLKENWELSGSDYNDSVKLWYFQYKFFGDKQPENYESLLFQQENFNDEVANYDLPFELFIQKNIIQNKQLNFNKYQALIQNTNVVSSPLYTKVLTHFYNYAQHNKEKIDNPLDLFSVHLISLKLNKSQKFSSSLINFDFTNIRFKGPFIEDSFNIDTCFNTNSLVSNNGYKWKYCFLTLLPILSTNTKHCTTTDIDIIDISKDYFFNEYGWFTKTILEELGRKSIVSDMDYI